MPIAAMNSRHFTTLLVCAACHSFSAATAEVRLYRGAAAQERLAGDESSSALWPAPADFVYAATLGKDATASIHLAAGDDLSYPVDQAAEGGLSGVYRYDRIGTPIQLKWKIHEGELAGTEFLIEKGKPQPASGLWTGRFTGASMAGITGTWSKPKGTLLPFSARLVAVGRHWESGNLEMNYPLLMGGTPLSVAANRFLTERRAKLDRDGEQWIRQRLGGEPPEPKGEDFHQLVLYVSEQWTVAYADSSMVALVARTSGFSGGTHPWHDVASAVFFAENGKVRPMALREWAAKTPGISEKILAAVKKDYPDALDSINERLTPQSTKTEESDPAPPMADAWFITPHHLVVAYHIGHAVPEVIVRVPVEKKSNQHPSPASKPEH